jgi:hypothetical protein
LSKKFNKLNQIGQGGKRGLSKGKSQANEFTMPGAKSAHGPQKTVYGELKLSEKLSNELNMLK